MKHSQAAERYAKASLALAYEQGAGPVLAQQVNDLLATLNGSDALEAYLHNPTVEQATKQQAVAAVAPQSHQIMQWSALAQNKRMDLLAEVLTAYERLDAEKNKIAQATVVSAAPLTDAVVNTLKEKLAQAVQKTIALDTQVDTSLIGGFIVKVDDLAYDASVAHQLSQLKEQLTQVNNR
jgi:F-type H+-transporting ATPase subunit delta